jgi:peroxiredoxin
VTLPGAKGEVVALGGLKGYAVIYCYPMTGQPGVALPAGWDEIPGARGCTPQSCSFRDHYQALQALSSQVYGLSTQTSAYQREMVERLHLPFPVLSDAQHELEQALGLPSFEVAGMRLLKRLTLVTHDAVIKAVHYPVFPSDSDPRWVMDCLKRLQA